MFLHAVLFTIPSHGSELKTFFELLEYKDFFSRVIISLSRLEFFYCNLNTRFPQTVRTIGLQESFEIFAEFRIVINTLLTYFQNFYNIELNMN